MTPAEITEDRARCDQVIRTVRPKLGAARPGVLRLLTFARGLAVSLHEATGAQSDDRRWTLLVTMLAVERGGRNVLALMLEE